MLPFAFSCLKYRGRMWKLGVFCGIFILRNAIYDSGMYIRFFLYGPSYLRQIMTLDQNESFGAIQTRLFVKWCARHEIDKAIGNEPKKQFSQLIILKSFRNQIFDFVMHLKNTKIVSRGSK